MYPAEASRGQKGHYSIHIQTKSLRWVRFQVEKCLQKPRRTFSVFDCFYSRATFISNSRHFFNLWEQLGEIILKNYVKQRDVKSPKVPLFADIESLLSEWWQDYKLLYRGFPYNPQLTPDSSDWECRLLVILLPSTALNGVNQLYNIKGLNSECLIQKLHRGVARVKVQS